MLELDIQQVNKKSDTVEIDGKVLENGLFKGLYSCLEKKTLIS